MNNRLAFIDFVRGLLNINPLERWSPQQAKLHPFITQQKFTGPFIPPMNLKSSSITKSPAPGVQQQQQAEAVSKQRAQAAQAQAQAQAQVQATHNAHTAYAPNTQMGYVQSPLGAAPPVYNSNVYSQQAAPPPYASQPAAYGQQMGMVPQAPPQISHPQYPPQQNLYAQATSRASRQRASTMDQQQGGIPQSIQRVASHLDPNAPIRLAPSPFYPAGPPSEYVEPNSAANARRKGSRAQGGKNRNFVQTLEDRTEEGYGQQQYYGP